MVNVKRRLGLEDTKVHCHCKNRGVWIDTNGACRNRRMHDEDCKYHRVYAHHMVVS